VLPVTLARLYLSSRFVESNGSQSAEQKLRMIERIMEGGENKEGGTGRAKRQGGVERGRLRMKLGDE
jgi:hypothetical protein